MLFSAFYKRFFLAASIFVAAGATALLTEQPLILLVPFLLLLLPVILPIIISHTYRLFYLLIFLLPLSTEYNFTPTLGIDFPDEILMMLITGLALLVFIHKPQTFPSAVLKHPLFLLLVIHLGWIFCTSLLSTNPLLSFKLLLAKIWFIIPFVVLPSLIKLDESQIKKVLYLLILPMLLVVLQSLLRHSFYQFSFEGIKETLSPFFRNHVNYSAMLVCLLPMLFVLRSSTAKPYKKYFTIGAAIALWGLVFAYSRGAWLAIIVGTIALVIFYFNFMKPFLIVMIVGVVALATWLSANSNYLRFAPDYNTTIFHENINEHLAATVQLKDVSNAERFYRWVAAGNMIAEKPVIGFGPNTFYQNYKPYTERSFRTWVSDNPEHSTVHNYFLLTLVEQGIPGFIFFTAFFIGMIIHCQRLHHLLINLFYKKLAVATGVMLAMIGSLLLSSDLVETDKIGSLFWLSLGLIIVLQTKLESQQSAMKLNRGV